MPESLRVVVLGLSLTSSWGNGHATTYRGLLRELKKRGHEVWFLERNVPWYADNRDLADPDFCTTYLYEDRAELEETYKPIIRDADAVIVGSYVPEGVDVGHWVTRTADGVTAFYDIDTPVTLAKLDRGDFEYLSPELIPRYNLYLSFTGGPTLQKLEQTYCSPKAVPLYCSFDPELYYPAASQEAPTYDLGYMGTYSRDRQSPLEQLLLEPARTWKEGAFVVAGPQYPADIPWPKNVKRIEHLPPDDHRDFYNSQRFTLNITRADMIAAGYSPSVRLFEAAACETPILSDSWAGIESFFKPGEEIILVSEPAEVLEALKQTPEDQRQGIAKRARQRVMNEHTAAHRAETLERYLLTAREAKASLRVGVMSK